MKKILIIQNMIPHYRKPVYNELSKYYAVTILHSGNSSVQKNDAYEEIIVPVKSIGPFSLQWGVLYAVRNGGYDIIKAMFNMKDK